MFPFQSTGEYLREDLLDFMGSGQQQSGIIWGSKQPNCVIITSGGSHGKSIGYNDKKNADGTWNYIGQGSKGDQNPYKSGNILLTNKDKTILLFSTRDVKSAERKLRGHGKKAHKFEGLFEVIDWELIQAPEGIRKGDHLIEYKLIAANNIFSNFEIESATLPESTSTSLVDLAKKIRANYNPDPNKRNFKVQEYRKRSTDVKVYALLRAKGICELCNHKAPFRTEKGTPFLEVHHIFRLSDDGPDLPENVAGLCPNCHRESHFGKEKDSIKEILVKKILLIEASSMSN